MARFKFKRRPPSASRRDPAAARPSVARPVVFMPHVPMHTEDAHAAIHELLEGHNFASVNDINAHLQSLLASGEVNRRLHNPDDPRSRARLLGGEALRTRGTPAGEQNARRALELDPECVDALLALAPQLSPETIPRLREIVEIARRQLPPETFADQRGSFWGIHSTRPFVRALQHLATSAFQQQDLDTAASACEEILSLNREDNLGVREILLAIYLNRAERDQARELIARFEAYQSTAWSWLVLLFAGRFEPDRHVRLDRLQDAVQANPHVLERIFGVEKVGKLSMDPIDGSPEDANNAMVLIRTALEKDPEAYMKWLLEELKAAGERPSNPEPLQ